MGAEATYRTDFERTRWMELVKRVLEPAGVTMPQLAAGVVNRNRARVARVLDELASRGVRTASVVVHGGYAGMLAGVPTDPDDIDLYIAGHEATRFARLGIDVRDGPRETRRIELAGVKVDVATAAFFLPQDRGERAIVGIMLGDGRAVVGGLEEAVFDLVVGRHRVHILRPEWVAMTKVRPYRALVTGNATERLIERAEKDLLQLRNVYAPFLAATRQQRIITSGTTAEAGWPARDDAHFANWHRGRVANRDRRSDGTYISHAAGTRAGRPEPRLP